MIKNIKKMAAGLAVSAIILSTATSAFAFDYTIQRGDSLFLIGQRFGVTVDALRAENNLTGDLIFAGQKISIPQGDKVQTYTVVRGDSLFLIAQRFGTSIEALKAENNITGDIIFVGQQLNITEGSKATTPQVENVQKYTVVRGDSLFLIAQRFGTTIEQLKMVNNLKGDVIYTGQVIDIPSGSTEVNTVTNAPTTSNTSNRIMNVTQKEMDLLARAVYSEARGEPFEGQVAVAAVIFNRVRHAEFPNTIEGVIFEPWAFTAVHDGQFWLTPNQTAYRAVEEALKGVDPSGGAIFYYNPVTATNQWIRTRQIIARIGRHVFAI